MGKIRDLTNQKFGMLVVIEQVGVRKGRGMFWKCLCECGQTKEVSGTYLVSGRTKSCGCLAKESLKTRSLTHGMSNNKLYYTWKAMVSRCKNPKNPVFKHYGGRGISVDSQWLDVKCFIEWALSNGYKEGLEIDRIDVNGNYEPVNCRWATRREQTNNKRNNVRVTINGETHTLGEWSDITGVNINTLQYRYYRGDQGERLIRKVSSEYDNGRKCNSNTGIRGISKTKKGKFNVYVQYKGVKKSATCKTLEEAINKLEELKKGLINDKN